MSETTKPKVTYGAQLPASELPHLDAVVILPTLNEEEGLAKTYPTIPLAELRREGHRVGVVIIDGGSTDRTLEVAERLGLTVLHQVSRGKGAAVREVLEWVAEQRIPYALMMDADCTYPPEMIGPSLTLLKAGGQLIVGVRNPVDGHPLGVRDIVHRVGNTLLNWMATQSTGHSILDLCSGFYAIDLRTRVHEGLSATGFEIEAELFLKAYRSGLNVLQIPISYRERIGTAKLRAVHDGGRIFVAILRARAQRSHSAATPPQRPGPLARELLAACLVHGSRDLIVLAHASRLREANHLVAQLNGTRFDHAIVVAEPDHPGPQSPNPLQVPVAGVNFEAAVLHLPAGSGDVSAAGPASVYLSNTRRVIRLDLDPAPRGDVTPPAKGPGFADAARSGGRTVPSRTARYLNSIVTVGSTLDSTGVGKEIVMHSANGFGGTEVTSTPTGVAPLPPLALMAADDRNPGRSTS